MSVKFRLGFTVDAETMFSLMAKLLPIEELSVEEIVPHRATTMPKQAKLAAPVKQRVKRARHSSAISLVDGVNGVIMNLLADGQPHRYRDLKLTVQAAGFASSGIGSRITRLNEHGAVVRVGKGLWRKA